MSDRAAGPAEPVTTGSPKTSPTVQVVLVPLDGSEFAERVVPPAARLARTVGAELHLLGVVDEADEVPQREADLDAAAGTSGVQRSVVIDTDPAGAIHRHRERLAHAVICMASHGRGRSAGVVGSVANDVIRHSTDPFIIVGPHIDDLAPSVGDGSAASGVVACVDDTPESSSILRVAWGWSTLLSEPLMVTTVAEPVPVPVAGVPAHRRFGPDGDVESFLSSVTGSLGAAGTDVTTHVVWDPISPAEGMRTYLREHPAGLVVVGSRWAPRPHTSRVRQRRGRHHPRQPVTRARGSAASDMSRRVRSHANGSRSASRSSQHHGTPVTPYLLLDRPVVPPLLRIQLRRQECATPTPCRLRSKVPTIDVDGRHLVLGGACVRVLMRARHAVHVACGVAEGGEELPGADPVA